MVEAQVYISPQLQGILSRMAVDLVNSLAAARLTRLVVEDEVFEPIRKLAFKADPQSKHVGFIVTCHACTSVWAGLLLMTAPSWVIPRRVREALAVSELTLLVKAGRDKVEGKGR
jgi:hypothetical protein